MPDTRTRHAWNLEALTSGAWSYIDAESTCAMHVEPALEMWHLRPLPAQVHANSAIDMPARSV